MYVTSFFSARCTPSIDNSSHNFHRVIRSSFFGTRTLNVQVPTYKYLAAQNNMPTDELTDLPSLHGPFNIGAESFCMLVMLLFLRNIFLFLDHVSLVYHRKLISPDMF